MTTNSGSTGYVAFLVNGGTDESGRYRILHGYNCDLLSIDCGLITTFERCVAESTIIYW
jgi:hypothetical protein